MNWHSGKHILVPKKKTIVQSYDFFIMVVMEIKAQQLLLTLQKKLFLRAILKSCVSDRIQITAVKLMDLMDFHNARK